MAFPISVARDSIDGQQGRVKQLIEFKSVADLRKWINDEKDKWGWLSNFPDDNEDIVLIEKLQREQLTPILELDGLIGQENLSANDVANIESTIVPIFRDRNFVTSDEVGVDKIIDMRNKKPAMAMGMLAQMMGIAISDDSADVFAGRMAWVNQTPKLVLNFLTDEKDKLQRDLALMRNELGIKKEDDEIEQKLSAIEKQKHDNSWQIFWLSFISIAVIGAVTGAMWALHGFEKKGNSQADLWLFVSERFLFYVLIVSCFYWAMKHIGYFLQEAWRTRQDAIRRHTALTLVLRDKESKLVKRTEADFQRISEEVFGGLEKKTPAEPKPESGISLPQIEVIEKIVEQVDKLRAAIWPGKDADSEKTKG